MDIVLTAEQAGLLRQHRKRVYAAVNELAEIESLLRNACPHLDPEQPQTCPVCRLYRMFANALNGLQGAADTIDAALANGPHPAAKRRTAT